MWLLLINYLCSTCINQSEDGIRGADLVCAQYVFVVVFQSSDLVQQGVLVCSDIIS